MFICHLNIGIVHAGQIKYKQHKFLDVNAVLGHIGANMTMAHDDGTAGPACNAARSRLLSSAYGVRILNRRTGSPQTLHVRHKTLEAEAEDSTLRSLMWNNSIEMPFVCRKSFL